MIGPYDQLLLNNFFWFNHSFYENHKIQIGLHLNYQQELSLAIRKRPRKKQFLLNKFLIWSFLLWEPQKSKMSARGPQNVRWGQERGLPVSFWALLSTFSKLVFRSKHSFWASALKSKMATRGPQNGRQGLERGLSLSFWALPSTFTKKVFWSEHSFYEKRSRQWGEKNGK